MNSNFYFAIIKGDVFAVNTVPKSMSINGFGADDNWANGFSTNKSANDFNNSNSINASNNNIATLTNTNNDSNWNAFDDGIY